MPPRPIAHLRQIAAPAAVVWNLISTPGYLEQCHPFCAANPVDRWPGAGSRDHVEYYNGRTLTRHFVGWHDRTGYDIELSDANGPVAFAAWRLDGNDARAVLTITLTPLWHLRLPPLVREATEALIVSPMLRRYLRAVLAGIEYRITTGRPATRNQFGPHRWFSPAV